MTWTRRASTLACSLAFVALLAAPSAGAQDGAVTFDVSGHGDDGFYFTVDGVEGKNPTLTVAPGATVTVRFTSVQGFHNFHVDEPVNEGTEFADTGASAPDFTFTVPADFAGELAYWCVPHKSSAMAGTFSVQAAPPPAPPAAEASQSDPAAEDPAPKKTPGLGVAAVGVVAFAVAVVLGRRA